MWIFLCHEGDTNDGVWRKNEEKRWGVIPLLMQQTLAIVTLKTGGW
jgi:hypothetical protein